MPNEIETRKCDVDGCDQDAVFSYSWDWGQQGVCCATHLTLLQQKAGQLNRTLMHTALAPTQPVPMARDERAKLIANGIVLEQELGEAKARGLELYRKNADLCIQVQTLTLREREANAQIRDGARALAVMEEKLEQRDREHAELVAELERLRTVASFVEGVAAAALPVAHEADLVDHP